MTPFGTLYLIPAPLSDAPLTEALPHGALELISRLQYFVVEELRTARRYLSKVHRLKTGPSKVHGLSKADPLEGGGWIDRLQLSILNEHTHYKELEELLQPLVDGRDVGLLSEAGLPAVADPGAAFVALAHQKGIKVTPMTGPSSLMLALMASGLNGQSFAFVGYLPVHQHERKSKIREIEKRMVQEEQTQIFMETPYRNLALLGDLLEVCAPQTLLCIASNLTATDAFIATKTIAQWRAAPTPPIHKVPTVFLVGRTVGADVHVRPHLKGAFEKNK